MQGIIDSHIHLDQYDQANIHQIVRQVASLITVWTDLASCQHNHQLAKDHPAVHPAFGFHPEQALPSERMLENLLEWMENHKNEAIAVGEVGLPYYLKKKAGNKTFPLDKYIELLETFILLAKKWDKPIILHAIYEDASLVCDLLEKHSIEKAHFHWFKGDVKTTERMITNRYHVSITPDVCYELDIQQLVTLYPSEQLMVETDGPWPFGGPFQGISTTPKLIHKAIRKIADLKQMSPADMYQTLLSNTKRFYNV